jgi:carboxylate-amine ligase
LNSVFAFPLSGRAPFVLTWDAFETYFEKMRRTGVVQSMKDFYWDIRPKPAFGTVEVRVMDTPFSIDRAAAIAAYIQTLARWLLTTRPFMPTEDDYLVYTFNRFEACRFGLDGTLVNPRDNHRVTIADDIVSTLTTLAPHAEALGANRALDLIRAAALARANDASWLRDTLTREGSLHEVVRQQCARWRD